MPNNLTRVWQGAAALVAVLGGGTLLAQAPATPPGADFLKRPPVRRLAPEVEQQLFLLPPGFHIEPVLTEPQIEDPVSVTFDGNGRMYVIEMRSYMRDADGSNSREPISRISRHEDLNGDGVYETHTVFADKLVLPRIAYPLDGGALLVLETDNRDLYKYTDTNDDGVADTKEVVYSNFGRVTNMEWQPGGMVWALDNWLYTTYNPFRLRLAPNGKVLREETDVNGGQWGTTQDNYGKTWFVDGGSETGPVNFQQPIVYGAFNVPDNFEPDFAVPWPAPGGIADMQGGMNRVRLPDGTLNHFTAAAGPEIYRGDRLPADFQGDLFFAEPVGRIVRRAKVVVAEGLTQLRNAYPQSEFIRSTDPLFRPVSVSNAPDGTLLVVDMYTGIIQDAQFVGPGSYLRRKVEQYALDQQHNHGRIWRVTADGATPDRIPPRMYGMSVDALVPYLQHANGWWRDTAQKLLVLRQNKSVVPALKAMVKAGTPLARIHALWTLEGLDSLDPILARELLRDADPQMRVQALRASETLYKAGNQTFAVEYRNLTKDPDPNVVIQAMLTLNLRKVPQATTLIQAARDTNPARGVKEIALQLLRPARAMGQPASNDSGMGFLNLTPDERASLVRGESTYKELCFSCHGNDGLGAPVAGAAAGTTLAPPLAGSTRATGHRDYIVKVLLSGLSGPLEGKEYNGGAVMVPMGSNTDAWIADVANYVRNAFGNTGRPYITPEQVTATRRATTSRKAPWTLAELAPTVPVLVAPTDGWKYSASVNGENANPSTTGRWDTVTAQQPGMWFQVELDQPRMIAEVQLDASAPTGRGNAGLGGFGGLGVTPGRAAVPAPARAGGAPAGAGPGRAGAAGGRGRGAATPPASGPAAYSVQLSTDGATWSAPLATGTGGFPTTVIAFTPTTAKAIRVTQTGASPVGDPWAVQGVRVYELRK